MKFQLVLASIFACLLQTDALAQQADIGTLVERTIERVRQQFPADADDRLGSYRTAFLRIGTATQIQALIPKSPETNIQAVSTQLIRDWFSANPDAYREILEFARIQGIATSEIVGIVRNSGLHAIKLGRHEEGERLLSLLSAFPSDDLDSVDLVAAYASSGNIAAADKGLPRVLERISINSAQFMAHKFGSVGYVYGAVKVIEEIRDHPEMLHVVAAALNGTTTRKERIDVSGLVSFVTPLQLEKLSVDDVTDDKVGSWWQTLHGCGQTQKSLFPPGRPHPLAHVPTNLPIGDCFRKAPGPIASLALLLDRSGEKALAETVLDRTASLLVAATTPENLEVYRAVLFVRRPVNKQDIELYQRMQKYLSSLGNVARVATLIESVAIGKKVVPSLQGTEFFQSEFILTLIPDSKLFEEALMNWSHPNKLQLELVRLEWALRQNDPMTAIGALDQLLASGNFRSQALAVLYLHHVRNSSPAVARVRDHFLNGVRSSRTNGSLRAEQFAYIVMETYLNYAIALGDEGLARDLAQDRFDAANTEPGLYWPAEHRGYFKATRLSSALLECYLLNAVCQIESVRFEPGDKNAANTFDANLTDVFARAGRMDQALLHVQRMSQPFSDIKAYPDYLREAWGHLAHAYARQGDIEKALAIIGEGKAGKPGGTVDAIVNGWIAAGHYKRQ